MKHRKENRRKGTISDCRSVRPWLFDYACKTGELKPAISALVKKHLAACPDCSKAAGDFNSVTRILRSIPGLAENTPSRLSPDRHRKILQSLNRKS